MVIRLSLSRCGMSWHLHARRIVGPPCSLKQNSVDTAATEYQRTVRQRTVRGQPRLLFTKGLEKLTAQWNFERLIGYLMVPMLGHDGWAFHTLCLDEPLRTMLARSH